MPKYGYLAVEGPHDAEFVCRLLRPFGLRTVVLIAELDSFFTPLVPTSYPHDGDLLKRMPVPLFLRSSTHVIAVHAVGGESQIVETIEENVRVIPVGLLSGIGVLLDSDKVARPEDRYSSLRDRLRTAGFPFPDAAGVVAPSSPRFGGFVLPDNQAQGTLESILLECAGLVYPNLLGLAMAHVDAAIGDSSLVARDRKDLGKPSGKDKAIVASIAAVLRPGKSVQVSIKDNRWLEGDALDLARVKAVQSFLADLFELAG